MSAPWGEFGFVEWLGAQIHCTATAKPRIPTPVPQVDLPGCAAGEVSWRRWLNWRQANSVTAFSVQLTRDIVAALALEGITPIETWLRHDTYAVAAGSGRKRTFDAYGDKNGVYAESVVRMPKDGIGIHQFDTSVLPEVYDRYPVSGVGPPMGANWLPGPYGFRAAVTRGDQDDNYDTLRVVSPSYICRYRGVDVYPGRYLRHWPLDPADEREPLIYPDKPRSPNRNIPGVAEYTLAQVTRWSFYLGCRIGDPMAISGTKSDGLVIAAPVVLTVSEAEVQRRALPHTAVSALTPGASREPSGSYRDRLPLVTFHIFNGLRAYINDPEVPGEYMLTITG